MAEAYLDELSALSSPVGSDKLVAVRGEGIDSEGFIALSSVANFAIPAYVPSVAQAVYVAKNGNDTTGDGSINRPYLTVQKALTSITDATTAKPYGVFVGPGIYDENTITLRGNIYLIGCGQYEGLGCRIGTSDNLITTDSTLGGGWKNWHLQHLF